MQLYKTLSFSNKSENENGEEEEEEKYQPTDGLWRESLQHRKQQPVALFICLLSFVHFFHGYEILFTSSWY